MIHRTKVLNSVLAASLGLACACVVTDAQAAAYQISVGEGTFGPAGSLPYQNGIIQQYTTNPDGQLDVPQFAGFKYSAAQHEINGIAGDYNVSAEASPAHDGTAHAYAFGDGGFSGLSTSSDAAGIADPQQGYTEATATVGYGFQVVGPSSTTPIPVNFDAAAYVTTSGTGYGSAYLVICSGNCQAPDVDWYLTGGESQKTYPGTTIDLLPNTIYAVTEGATAYGHSPYEDGPYDATKDTGFADAYVDPTFTLSGRYASLYHFEGLPDAASAGGVPEPSTWAMLLIGFAGMGGAMLRRHGRLRKI